MTIQGTGSNINGTKGHFTLAWSGGLLLAAVFGTLCLSPAPAAAGFVTFDLNSAKLVYDATAQTLTVTENVGSDFLVRKENGIDVLDSAKIIGGASFDLSFTLNMSDDLLETDQWSASGILSFTDKNTTAAMGDFASRSIMIYPYGGGVLQIEGTLSSSSASILQNVGASWVFEGDQDILGEHPLNGADGTAGQITIDNPEGFDEGAVFVLKFGVNTHSLDELFGSNFTKVGGEVKGNITPEPATLGLLAMGGMTLLARRKRKHTV